MQTSRHLFFLMNHVFYGFGLSVLYGVFTAVFYGLSQILRQQMPIGVVKARQSKHRASFLLSEFIVSTATAAAYSEVD